MYRKHSLDHLDRKKYRTILCWFQFNRVELCLYLWFVFSKARIKLCWPITQMIQFLGKTFLNIRRSVCVLIVFWCFKMVTVCSFWFDDARNYLLVYSRKIRIQFHRSMQPKNCWRNTNLCLVQYSERTLINRQGKKSSIIDTSYVSNTQPACLRDWRHTSRNLKPANICLLLERRSPPRLLGLDNLRARCGMLRSNPTKIIREVLFFEYHWSLVRGLNTCRVMRLQDCKWCYESVITE